MNLERMTFGRSHGMKAGDVIVLSSADGTSVLRRVVLADELGFTVRQLRWYESLGQLLIQVLALIRKKAQVIVQCLSWNNLKSRLKQPK